jgi:hypothetical protein
MAVYLDLEVLDFVASVGSEGVFGYFLLLHCEP